MKQNKQEKKCQAGCDRTVFFNGFCRAHFSADFNPSPSVSEQKDCGVCNRKFKHSHSKGQQGALLSEQKECKREYIKALGIEGTALDAATYCDCPRCSCRCHCHCEKGNINAIHYPLQCRGSECPHCSPSLQEREALNILEQSEAKFNESLKGTPMYKPTVERETDWEKSFNEEFKNVAWHPNNKSKILSFISNVAEQTRKETEEEVIEDLVMMDFTRFMGRKWVMRTEVIEHFKAKYLDKKETK